MQRRFEGKVALVTGGASGIGKAIALRLLREGARVAVLDCDAGGAAETGVEFASAFPGQALFIAGDVAIEDDVCRAVADTIGQFTQLDALINNAAIASPGATPLEELTLEAWRRTLDVNLTGAMLCAKHAAPHLRAARGAIVNISSTRALQSEPNTFAYTASKGGLAALTHALAVSLGPDVRANCIAPGWIDASQWKPSALRRDSELRPIDHAQHPAGRVGKPEDVAGLAAFLLSRDAAFITGQNYVIDGGMRRKMQYEP